MSVLSRIRTPLGLTLVTAAAVLALVAGVAWARAAAPTLNVALDWFPNPDHVAIYYAQEKGYFTKAGVTVNPKTPSDPSAGLKLVATNKFDLAIYYEGDMFYAAQQGLPVIAVGSLVPTPLNSMIAKAGGKVTSLKSLKGATIGNSGLPFDGAVLQTIAKKEGFASGDLKSINVGYNLVPALLTGKADAIEGGYWNIEAVQVATETGTKPVVFTMGQLGVPNYDELVIVANRDRLKSDAAYATAVRGFLTALKQGINGARKDVAGSIAIMKKDTTYKAKDIEAMLPPTLQALGQTHGAKIGCFSLAQWQSFADWLLKNRLVTKAIAPSTIATNAYNPGC